MRLTGIKYIFLGLQIGCRLVKINDFWEIQFIIFENDSEDEGESSASKEDGEGSEEESEGAGSRDEEGEGMD